MRILLLILGAFFISSCAKVSPEYFSSTIFTEEEKLEYNKIADDFVNFINPYFAPNKTTFFVSTEDFDKKFYDYLTDQLRSKGYAVTDKTFLKNLVFLSYKISQIDNETLLVVFNVNESKINRIYKISGNKLVSSGGITSFNFDLQK